MTNHFYISVMADESTYDETILSHYSIYSYVTTALSFVIRKLKVIMIKKYLVDLKTIFTE